MEKKYVLIAIKPLYSKLIKNGTKTVELRRVAPKISRDDILVIYESAPISKITAYAEVDDLLTMSPEELWSLAGNRTMVEKDLFDKYFENRDVANGIVLKDAISLKTLKGLDVVSKRSAPQNYYYITEDDFNKIIE